MDCAAAIALAGVRAWLLLAIGAAAGFLLLGIVTAGSDADDAQDLASAYVRGKEAGRAEQEAS